MKKLPVFMLAIVLSGIATAQTVIPRLGGTMSKVSLADYMINFKHENTFKLGFLIGVGYEIAINDLLAIQPEFLFHQKGTRLKFSNAGYDQTYGLNYLEIPVLAKLKFGEVYVIAGPYGAYGIGGNYKMETGDDGSYFTSKVKFGEEPANYSGDDIYINNAFDMGIAIGGGVVLLEKLEIGIRYNHGFTDMDDFTLFILEANGDDTNKLMNRSIQLSVGYRIALN